jgi:hypothetical protein
MRERYLGLLLTVAVAAAAVDAVTSLSVAQAPQIVRPPARMQAELFRYLAGQQRSQLGPAGPRGAARCRHSARRATGLSNTASIRRA